MQPLSFYGKNVVRENSLTWFFTLIKAPPGWETQFDGKWNFLEFSSLQARTASCWSPPGWRASSGWASVGAWQETCGWCLGRTWSLPIPETRLDPPTFRSLPPTLHRSQFVDARELHLKYKQRKWTSLPKINSKLIYKVIETPISSN